MSRTDSFVTLVLGLCLVLPIHGIISNDNILSHASISDASTQISGDASHFFKNVNSIGNIAICYAEGNCEEGNKSSRYFGHDDPGNGKKNKGYCSSQKSAQNIDEANKHCLDRTHEALPRINSLMQSKGIQDKLFYVNIVDLHNQASDWVWQGAVSYFASNQSKLSGDELIIESRVYGFYRDGRLDASGLFNACKIDGNNQQQAYKCIHHDQERRFNEIKKVMANV